MTKDGLRNGTRVRLIAEKTFVSMGDTLVFPAGSILIVKDTMDRKNYNKPDRIGVGPADRGIAFGVTLDEVELERICNDGCAEPDAHATRIRAAAANFRTRLEKARAQVAAR